MTPHPLIGGGTLHALTTAMRMLGVVLYRFVARGGRVLDPDDDSEVSLEIVFGSLWRDD